MKRPRGRGVARLALAIPLLMLLLPAIGILPASAGSLTATFSAVGDSYVSAGSRTTNYGTASSLKLATSPAENAYLKFNVSGLSGPVQSATLRVYANSGLKWGFDAYSTPNTSWAESTLTYNNAPALGTKLGSFPSGALTGWIQLDVTPAVTGNGTYSFALVGTYWMEISLASRETGANAPQLVVTTAGTPDTTPPTPPANLTVGNPTATTLPLSWSPSTDNVAVTGYDVYLNGTKLTTTTTTSYNVTNLTCNTNYSLTIDAYDAAGNTSTTSTVSAVTASCPDTTAPSTPSITATAATPTSISLSWTGSTDDVGVAGYGLYNGGGTPVGTTTSTSYTVSGLTCGTSYTLSVDAFDAAGNRSGKASTAAQTSPCPPDTTAPTAPTNLKVTSPTPSSLPLTWTPSTDNVAVAGYDIYVNGISAGTSTASAYTFTGLKCGTAYTLGVDAFDAAGNLSTRTNLGVNTAGCGPSATTFSAVGDSYVSAGSRTTNYGTASSLKLATSPAENAYLKFNVSGLSGPVQSATLRVYANSGLKWGFDAYSTPNTSWAESTLTYNNAPALGTKLGSFPSGALTGWIQLDVTPAVTGNGTYSFALVGTYWMEISLASRETGANAPQLVVTTAGTPDTTPPTPPANLTVGNPTATTLPLSWSPSTDNVAVTGYDVYLNGTKLTTTTTTSYNVTNLTCNTNYSLTIDAYDAAGNTSTTSTTQATTNPCATDTTPPTVSITSPPGGALLSGMINVQASASDETGVVNVQLSLDGVSLGPALTSPPYALAWNTALATNGTHTLSAVATDAAGNKATAPGINVTVLNTGQTTPTPVPAANVYGVTVGPGFVEASAREVVRTANNTVYVVTADDDTCQGGGSGVIRVWKGVGAQAGNSAVPTGFAEQDTTNHPSSAGSGDCTYSPLSILASPDVRLDRSGLIEMAYIDGSSGNVYYQTFSTLSDTWVPRTIVGTGAETASGSGWPREGDVALTLDSNDVPHVVYATSGTSNQLMYTDRSGGSWSMPISVTSGTNIVHPSMVTSLDGTLHLTWLANSQAAHSTIGYAHYANGSWSAPETVSAGDALVLANGDSDQGPSIATDTNNTPYVLFMDGTVLGHDDYVRMRYRNTDGTWSDNTPPGGSGGASNPSATMFAHTPQNYISSTNGNYVFLGHDVNFEFGYQYQLGGQGTNWGPFTTLDPRSASNPAPGDTVEPGTDGSASVRFDPLRDNNTNIIDVIYFDERDNSDAPHHHATVYYKAIVIGAG